MTLAIHKVASHLGTNLTDDEAKKLAEHLDFDKMKKNDAMNMLQHETHTNQNSAFIRVAQCQQWKTKMGSDLIRTFDEWSRKQIEGTDFPVHWAC